MTNRTTDTFNGETEIGRYAVVVVCRITLERVTSVHHIFTDVKKSSLYDISIDQVCPLIRQLWIAFC